MEHGLRRLRAEAIKGQALDMFGRKGQVGGRPSWHGPEFWNCLKHRRPDLAEAEQQLWQDFLEDMKKQICAAGIWDKVQSPVRNPRGVPGKPPDSSRTWAAGPGQLQQLAAVQSIL